MTQPDPYYPVHYRIDAPVLKAQLSMFRRFCAVLLLDEIFKRIDENQPLPKRCVALTFDDGYRELFTLVHPLLQQYQLPATAFLATDALDKGFLWPDLLRWAIRSSSADSMTLETLPEEPCSFDLRSDMHRLRAVVELDRRLKRIPENIKWRILEEIIRRLHQTALERFFVPRVMLSWNEAEIMAKEGWTIGGHTVTHPIFTQTSLAHVEDELRLSREKLAQRLGQTIDHFAYPNGQLEDFSKDIEQLVAGAGYRSAFSTIMGINNRFDNRWALKRLNGAQVSLREFVRVFEEADGCPV